MFAVPQDRTYRGAVFATDIIGAKNMLWGRVRGRLISGAEAPSRPYTILYLSLAYSNFESGQAPPPTVHNILSGEK